MEQSELKKNLKNMQYSPSKEADDRIAWMIKNSYENEKNSVTDFQNESKSNQSNLFFNFKQMKLKTLALIGTPVVAVGVLSTIGAMYVLPMITPVNTTNLTDLQKQEIYRNILANNSEVQPINSTINYELGNTANSTAEVMPSEKRIMPNPGGMEDMNRKLVKTTVTNINGPKKDVCKAFYNARTSSNTYESISYYDNKNYSVTGYSETYGDIKFIYVGKTTPSTTVSYEYKGGEYAIQLTYKLTQPIDFNPVYEGDSVVDSDVPQEPVSIEEQIEMRFGEDTDIIGKETIDGKEYYLMQYSYGTQCGLNAEYESPDFWNGETYEDIDSKMDDRLIIRNYVNSTNYAIERTDTYYKKADTENLIYTSVTDTTIVDSTFEEAAAIIKIDSSIPVKEPNVEDQPVIAYDHEKELTRDFDYFQKQGFPIIDLSSIGYKINSAFTTDYYNEDKSMEEYNKLYQSRDFYPEGEAGDELYNYLVGNYNQQNNNIDYPTSRVEYSFSDESNNNSFIIAKLIDEKYEDIDIINTLVYYPIKNQDKSIEDVKVNINGNVVAGKLYQYKYQYEGYVESPAAVSDKLVIDPMPGNDQTQTLTDSGYFLIVPMESEGYKLVISETNNGTDIYPASSQEIIEKGIKTYKLDNSSKKELVKQLMDYYNESAGEPMPIEGQK